jgi:agmatine deiminase
MPKCAAFGMSADAAGKAALNRISSTRESVMLPSREILPGGGNIHCVTQQQPASRGAA